MKSKIKALKKLYKVKVNYHNKVLDLQKGDLHLVLPFYRISGDNFFDEINKKFKDLYCEHSYNGFFSR